MKKTKVVCTMGPNTNNPEIMRGLVKNGMNVARFNFSHGDYEEHKGRMDLLKQIREEEHANVAILLDTKGPEIRTGLLETADGGTIFLDEINSMPMNLQSKLLRALQENKIRRIGAKDTIDINVKIIAALNKDPMKAIEDKELRMDLYYRLSVLNITIPPLRERKDDISVLPFLCHVRTSRNGKFTEHTHHT